MTNFSNDKQTQESLENGFPETIFRETNKANGTEKKKLHVTESIDFCFFFFCHSHSVYVFPGVFE